MTNNGFISFTRPDQSDGRKGFFGLDDARDTIEGLFHNRDISLTEKEYLLRKINTTRVEGPSLTSQQNSEAVKLLQDTVQGENGIFVKFKNAYLLRQRN